jgi:diguanylate cyclase (GGDEF)-like protein
MLVVIAAASYLEGRAIVRTLQTLVGAANGIARGRLDERVPVRGRDELAQLGRAFNDMANQLERRIEELGQERARLVAAVDRIGETLEATHDTDQLLHVVLETAVEATGASGAVLTTSRGVLRTGEADPEGKQLELPLASGQTTFGTLTLTGPRFDEEQLRTASSFAAQAVVALENARLHAIVARQAQVDGLTGIANRRHLEEALTLELARAKRFDTSLSIVLADLDDFKAINDRHGHPTGDLVLREFAGLLGHALRDVDLAGRWGGEEFLLVLPGTDGPGAAQVAERIRASLEAASIPVADGELHVTASFGVASYAPGTAQEELFEHADEALYRAKAAGKNRIG